MIRMTPPQWSHCKTSSWYYSSFLVKSFSYIDLVLQDTPLDLSDVESSLRKFVEQVDNLSDRQEQKVDRMRVRFSRVRLFLKYLLQEEQREQTEFDLSRRGGIWQEPFVNPIWGEVEGEIRWIERRLKENRERYAEDMRFDYGSLTPHAHLTDDDL